MDPPPLLKHGEWKETLERLLHSQATTIRQLLDEIRSVLPSFEAVNVALLLFCLLRDNLLSLKTRLTCLLILASIGESNSEYGVYILDLIGDVYDQSLVAGERTLCSWILAGSISHNENVSFSELMSSNDWNDKTFQRTIRGVYPSFRISYEVPSFILRNPYPIRTGDTDLREYMNHFEGEQFLVNVPSFDRPSFSLPSSASTFEFISPLPANSLSLLFLPVQKESIDPIQDILIRSTNSILSDEEVRELVADEKGFRRAICACVTQNRLTSPLLRAMIQYNPLVAADVIRTLLSTATTTNTNTNTLSSSLWSDALLQSPLSIHVLHIASQLLRLETIPKDFFPLFVDRSVQRITEIRDHSQQVHLIQCFCVLLAGVFHRQGMDAKRIREIAVKLQELNLNITEVECLFQVLDGIIQID